MRDLPLMPHRGGRVPSAKTISPTHAAKSDLFTGHASLNGLITLVARQHLGGGWRGHRHRPELFPSGPARQVELHTRGQSPEFSIPTAKSRWTSRTWVGSCVALTRAAAGRCGTPAQGGVSIAVRVGLGRTSLALGRPYQPGRRSAFRCRRRRSEPARSRQPWPTERPRARFVAPLRTR